MAFSSFLAPPSIMASSSFLAPPSSSSLVPPSSIMYAWGGRINYNSPLSSSITPPLRSNSSCSTAALIAIETSTRKYNNSDHERMISGTAPWLMLPPVGGESVYSFYSLTEKKVVDLELKGFGCDSAEVMGSSHGFLVLNDQQSHIMFLYNPISGRRIHLPSLMYTSSSDKEIGIGPGIKKLIISHDESTAMMIFGPENRLALCSPGGSHAWTPLGPTLLGYNDVVFSNRRKMFMCCTAKSDVEEWDALGHHNWVPQLGMDVNCELQQHWWLSDIEDLIADDSCVEEPYVVYAEHSDQLYLVCRYIMGRTTYLENINRYSFPLRDWDDSFPRKTIGFDVYKLTRVDNDNNMFKLNSMEGSLDNLVMFIGVNHSFALPADEYPELKADSIYFTDHPEHTPLFCQPGIYDTAIYSFNDRTFLPLEYPPTPTPTPNQNDDNKIEVPVQPLWFTPSPH